jgi:LL-diaminopimelate aminotransferase
VRVSLIADCDRLGEAMDRIRKAGFRFDAAVTAPV